MKNLGSCGLKHARYDTSWRLFAARCLLVQNSLTSVSTMMGRFARPTLVIFLAVGRPFHLNARNSLTTPCGPCGRSGDLNCVAFAPLVTVPLIGTSAREVQRPPNRLRPQ